MGEVKGDNRGEGLFSLLFNYFMTLFLTEGAGQWSKLSQDM